MGKEITIRIENLKKQFGKVTVLDGINMELQNGNIYGLIGRNGSGKTVLLKLLCGLLNPSGGSIYLNGELVKEKVNRAENMGIIIENPGFLPEYNGFQNLKFLADIKGMIGKGEIREAIQLVGLNPDSKKHVSQYSLGMRQRLGLAQALMEDPEILLLDEPMNGLDNEGVEEIREVLLKQKKRGKLVVIASHSQEDISILCDGIFRLDRGRLI